MDRQLSSPAETFPVVRPEQRFEHLIEGLDAIVWEMDISSWRFTYVSHRAEDLLGYPLERWYQETDFWAEQLVHPADRSWAVPFCVSATKEGRDHRFDYRAMAADGRIVWLRDAVRVVSDAEGRPRYLRGVMMDISAQKETEGELRERELQLAEAQRIAHLGSWEWDLDKDHVTGSDELYRIYGLEPQSAPSTLASHLARVHPDDRDRVREALEQARRTGKSFDFEERIIRPDGEVRTLHTRGAVISDAHGSAIRLIGTSQDITEQRSALDREIQLTQERLARKEAEAARKRVTDILESITDAFFTLDAQWRFTYLNSQAESLLQRRRDELIGRNVWDEFPQATEFKFYEMYHLAVREQRTVEFQEYFPPLNGWFEVKAYPSERGGLSVYFRNITERRRTEEALQYQSYLTRTIAENATSGLFMMDERGHCTYMNPAAEEMIGYTLDEVRDIPLHDAIHHHHPDRRPYPMAECPIDRALPEDFSVRAHEDVFIRKDGTFFPVLCAASPIFRDGTPVGTVIEVRDITDEKRAQRELRRGEERYRSLIEATSAIVWSTPVSGEFETDQPQWSAFTGQSFEELKGWGWLNAIHPEDQAHTAQSWSLALENRAVLELEHRIRRHDGEYRHMQIRAVPILEENGELREWIGIHTDVTEQRRAREALIESERQFRFLADSIPVLVWTARPDGSLDYVSRQTMEYFGLSEEQILGDGWQSLLHPDQLERVGQRWRHSLETGEPYEIEFLLRHRDGEYRWHLGRALPQRDEQGEIIRWLGSNTDIQLQKEAEKEREKLIRALNRERERLQGILTEAPALIALYHGPDHVITMVNRLWHQLTGRKDVLGKTVREVFPEVEQTGLFDLMDQVYATGEPYIGRETRVLLDRRGDGTLEETFWNFVWQPITNSEGRMEDILVHAVEVTDQVHARRQAEQKAEELLRLARQLEVTNRELDQFAYVASHDLKAPLRGIANLSQWIEEDLEDDISPEVQEHLDLLRGRVHRMEGLIDGILQYSRAGRVREAPETVDVGALLHEVTDLLAPPEHFTVVIEEPMPTLAAERLPLQQVFMNLLGNAIKYNQRQDGRVEVRVREAGEFYQFSVADNGPGIAPEYHERIFGIFQTLQARDKVEGTGIGLSLVRKIVENRGGKVWVESDGSAGSTFHFLWPKETKDES